MQSTQKNGAFHLDFKYNPVIITAVKLIPGARWNGKAWTIPLSERRAVDELVARYGKKNTVAEAPEQYSEVPPMPELEQEYKDILKAKLLRMPYHYQEQGIAYSLKHKRVMNADDMGGGKTTSSICTIVAAGLDTKCGLVVCKGSGKFMWEREFKIVAGMKSVILTDSVKNTWYQFYQYMGISVFITNYESLEKFFVQSIKKVKGEALCEEHIEWKMHPLLQKPMKDLFEWVILDESHEIRNEGTVKSEICTALGEGKQYRIALSGTPIVNKSADIYQQLKFLGRTKNTKEGKKAFFDRYCGSNGSKSTNSKELHYKLSTSCYFRRNKKEFGIDLPELTMQLVYSDITNRKEYDHAKKNLADYLLSHRGKTEAQVEKSMNAEAMVLIGVLQNIAARGKMRDAVEEIDSCLSAGRKIVVFINQKEIKELLIKHYPKGLVISGEENADQKNRAEQEFNTCKEPVPIFVSIKAGGVGINLQKDCQDILNLEYPWHPAFYYQCIARVHRNGVKNGVMCKNLLGKGTVDEDIWQIIESKKEIADTITGSNDDDIKREIVDKIKQSLFNK